MPERTAIDIVCCHAEGEVGDVIVGGVEPPPGATIREQARFIAEDGSLRAFVLQEPRGGITRHVNLLVPAKSAGADIGFIIMEPDDTPPMSGSNTMCVATVVLETGIIKMTEPETRLTLEAPGGLVEVVADCRDGKARRITLANLPSFADRLDAKLEVPGLGTLTVDTAYGGDTFVLIDAAALGFALTPDEARDLAAAGMRIADAASRQLSFRHPERPDLERISFCQFTGPLRAEGGRNVAVNAVAIRPGRLDRSPTGTGLSARLAVLHARGLAGKGFELVARSVIGSEFEGRIVAVTTIGAKPAIRPAISGRAWRSGRRSLVLDPGDPWPSGYRLADTWPNAD